MDRHFSAEWLVDESSRHVGVAIVGGGQAGLSMSYFLRQRGIDHVVLEKHEMMHTWRTQRWDSFSLVTPNWQCDLPGHPYRGNEPQGFMRKNEILQYLEEFAKVVDAPIVENVEVLHARSNGNEGFSLKTSMGALHASQLVVASGGYHQPIIPHAAQQLPQDLVQLHSAQYRNSESLPEGAVLVVGSGQSGAQIAEDLHLAGRRVYLATGDAPRCSRFYRGRDVVDWLAEMGYYDMSVSTHPLREGVRDKTNHYVTGRDGGRDIDLRKFAKEGMELYGRLTSISNTALLFEGNLKANLDGADQVLNDINASIDRFIDMQGIDAPPGGRYEPTWEPDGERTVLELQKSQIRSIIWCIGFRPDFHWLDAPVFNAHGHPQHHRGLSALRGLYFLGLPWLHTWGSGRFSGVARDALYLADSIEKLWNQPPFHHPDERCIKPATQSVDPTLTAKSS